MATFKTKNGTELPLLDLRGKPYLQVAHRIVWFREEHPDWIFGVEFPQLNDKLVMAKATIVDETGKVRATAHKVEHFAHFSDAIEKSETGAIGRALAMIGYGTQFAPDIDEEDRLADAPVPPARRPLQNRKLMEPKKPDGNNPLVNEAMRKKLLPLSQHAGWTPAQVSGFLQNKFGIEKSEEITLTDYKILLDILESKTTFEEAMELNI